MPESLHKELINKYYWPFHEKVKATYEAIKAQGFSKVYHIDAHSMPSLGTQFHRDPGETRAEIVISDLEGKSCEPEFKDLVVHSFKSAGFEVAYNWPYKGGRVTEIYGPAWKGAARNTSGNESKNLYG